eukprot:5192665-Pyramimonas_sp.AAC.1
MRAHPRSCRPAQRCPAHPLWLGTGARPLPPRCREPRAPAWRCSPAAPPVPGFCWLGGRPLLCRCA